MKPSWFAFIRISYFLFFPAVGAVLLLNVWLWMSSPSLLLLLWAAMYTSHEAINWFLMFCRKINYSTKQMNVVSLVFLVKDVIWKRPGSTSPETSPKCGVTPAIGGLKSKNKSRDKSHSIRFVETQRVFSASRSASTGPVGVISYLTDGVRSAHHPCGSAEVFRLARSAWRHSGGKRERRRTSTFTAIDWNVELKCITFGLAHSCDDAMYYNNAIYDII